MVLTCCARTGSSSPHIFWLVVDIMYECADICEHEFDVEVELGMSGLRVNYTMSNASSVIVWKVIAIIT